MTRQTRTVAYLRVSTDVQVEQGQGLDVQRDAIKAWAKRRGHRIVGWYTDEGVSGSNGIEGRDGLADALTALADGDAEALVVAKLDRLARSLTVQEGTLAKAWDLGAAVYAVDLGLVAQDDPDDPMRTAMRQMVGVFAQLERGMIAARMRAGKARKRDAGEWTGTRVPYGQRRIERGKLAPDPAEAAVLDRIVALRDGGASYRQIVAALDADGITTRKGTRWNPNGVRTVYLRVTGRAQGRAA